MPLFLRAAVSAAERIIVGSFLINRKRIPTTIQNIALTLKSIITRGEKESKQVFSPNSTNYRITKTSGHIYSII